MNKDLLEAKKSIKTTRRLLTFLVGVLGVLLFTIIALVIWAVYTEMQKPATYAECILDKDSKLLETYPEQCVVDGKSYTNPVQKIEQAVPAAEPLSSEDWLIYVPDDESYTIKLIDGWNFESVDIGVAEVLTACVSECVYNKETPAQLVNKRGSVNEDAQLKVTNGKEPVIASSYLSNGSITLDEGGTATRYIYNDGTVTNYLYVAEGKSTTVMLKYTQANNAATSNIPYVEEMVSTISLSE